MMFRSKQRVRFAVGAAVLLAANAPAQAPSLRHGAPQLGSVLELRVSNAPALAHVVLFASSRPGDQATPWGQLELERAAMQPVASGFTDAGGEWTYSTLVPADPALAEAPIHYQALIEPAGAPALLSDAVHLRLLGSRAYVLCAGSSYPTSSPTNGELSIVSLVRNERVAAVEFGYLGAWQPQRDSVPVFDASFSRGAVVPLPDELVFFDPFFGRVTERQALIAASQRIFASTDGERMFVLDGAATSTRIRVIEIATGDTLRSIALPAVAFGREWLVDPVREIAYVAGASSGVLAPFVERVDLAAGVDLGPVIVGAPLSPGITAMARSGDVVLVATDGSPLASASLARILETGAAPSVDIAPNLGNTSQIEPLPAVGAVALWSHHLFFPGGSLRLERLAIATTAQPIGVPQFGGVIDLAPSATGLWAVSANSGFVSGGYSLSRYDVATETWYDSPSNWYAETPTALATFDDGQGERVCIAVGEVVANIVYVRPKLVVVEPSGGTSLDIPIGAQPRSVLVLAVP